MTAAQSAPIPVYIGTYTKHPLSPRGRAEGIYLASFDPATGTLSEPALAAEANNPTFLALAPSQRFLYSVGEVPDDAGQARSAILAFARDPETGGLTLLNEQSPHGPGPAHVSVDQTGQVVMAANYRGGSIAAFPVQEDGSLGPATTAIQHHGSGPHPTRQEAAHAHSINPDPGNRFVLVADLGIDQVLVYRLDLEGRRLVPNDPPGVALAPGAGPRHVAYHPSAPFVYVINELGNTVTAFRYDGERGTLAEIQTVPTLPADFNGANTAADIHIHRSGRFLYGSNRGHDSIAAFAVDPASGRLEPLGHVSTRGRTPRNFGIDPTGAFLLAANQDTDTIVVYHLDERSGLPEPTGQVVGVPSPVCVRFVPPL